MSRSSRGRRFDRVAVVASLSVAALGSAGILATHASAAPRRVIVIVMENHGYSSIVGSASAPYINGTLIRRGRLFTNYYANFHPSLPNYLAMTSGSNEGCTSDSCSRNISAGNIFRQLWRHHIGFGSYAESMSGPCSASGGSHYAGHHNPEIYYTNMAGSACNKTDLPFSSFNTSKLRRFSFVVPNLIDDMHDGTIQQGDAWLSKHVPAMVSAGAVVIVVFDEGSTGSHGGGHVLAVERGKGIKHARHLRFFSHYSLLAGLVRHFGVTQLKNAAKARPLPI